MGFTSSMALGRESVGWSVAISILMIIAGLLAIVLPGPAGIAINLFVGWMLVFSAIMHFVYAWQTRHGHAVAWELLVGALYLLVGVYLLRHPIRGLATLTIALAFYLWIEGILEFVSSYMLRALPGSGWLLFDGVVTVILAFLIWRTWPENTEWAIGTLVGISILFSGVSRLMISLRARHVTPRLA